MRRFAAIVLVFAVAFALTACSEQNASGGSAGKPSEQGPPKQEQAAEEKAKEPEYTSWTVYINDDDSYSAGGMTYKIALNLTAANPSSDVASTYKGKATASTSTQGAVGGGQLKAQAIAQSGNLQFTLNDSAGPDLAQLEPANWKLSGTGTITMKAAGTASIGAASGSYGNTSSQKIDVQVSGSKVTLSVVIQGHKYTFHGTISGK